MQVMLFMARTRSLNALIPSPHAMPQRPNTFLLPGSRCCGAAVVAAHVLYHTYIYFIAQSTQVSSVLRELFS